jgi:hypothetical protein
VTTVLFVNAALFFEQKVALRVEATHEKKRKFNATSLKLFVK